MTINRLALIGLLTSAVFVATLYAQATNIHSGGTLPTSCRTGDLYVKTGTGAGLYSCISDVWTGPYATSAGSIGTPGTTTDEAIVRWNGTGGSAIQDSGITISDGNVINFPDGVKQTFNPDGTNAGFNFGSQAGDPSSLANGDCWYNSSTTKFKCRQNGSTVDMISTASFTNLLDVKFARKTGTEQVSASSSLQDDDHLTIAIGASETWVFDFELAVSTGTEAGDIKIAVNVPTSATGTLQMVGLNPTLTSIPATVSMFSTTDLTDTGSGFFGIDDTVGTSVQMRVVVVNSTNAGNVKLRWAQNNASGSTTLNTNSYVIAYRVN